MPDIPDAAERAAIARYVHEFHEVNGVRHTSTFRAALRDARQLGGRNLDTGAIETEPSASWPSALTYLILLDQVGKVICPAPRRSPNKGDLRDALHDFDPTLSVRDTAMLYALRCAFAHEFALANQGRKMGKPDPLRHRFTLYEAGEPTLVKYDGDWNGVYGSGAVGGPTSVNLTEMANLVERIVAETERLAAAGDLRLVSGVTTEMVLYRWGFRVLPKQPPRPTGQ